MKKIFKKNQFIVTFLAVLIAVANIKDIGAIPTFAQEKYLPIYNVQTDENKVAFTMNCAW